MPYIKKIDQVNLALEDGPYETPYLIWLLAGNQFDKNNKQWRLLGFYVTPQLMICLMLYVYSKYRVYTINKFIFQI